MFSKISALGSASWSVLEREYSQLDRSIDVHVSNLRRELGALPDGTERIRSVRNVGYIYAHSAAIESARQAAIYTPIVPRP